LHYQYATTLREHPRVAHFRVTGTIMAFDVVTPNQPGYFNAVGMQIRQRSIELGFLLRPLGNVVYLMPPYCITESELAAAYGAIGQILDELD
jgi:adenosylmethionine---8-amino-7-oxononanoate aminotransferase